ncbi:MAG: D-alanine--D-alanine ligase [Proteobacteria bacterium]|nr:D-alanine--D-alanine ligase [Pseudomonadota bacterium]
MTLPAETLNLLLMFGGRSCEHAVSVTSAKSLIAAIADVPYQVQFVGITEQGQWRWALEDSIDSIVKEGVVNPLAGAGVLPDLNSPGRFLNADTGQHFLFQADVIFPLLHGPYGEDGTLQGLFEMFDVPYVGCGVAASACGMDKLVSKRLFEKAGIPQADYIEVRRQNWLDEPSRVTADIEQFLSFPVFVKPANMGSSVGISRVSEPGQLKAAIDLALEFDSKVLVENGFENMLEVECAVLGNEQPEASVVGEIRPGAAFYDYASKYVEDTSTVVIPAPMSDAASQKVQALAIKAFKALDGSGLARADFFVDVSTDKVWLNEINTLPGFTPISMYPKLWAASGLPYTGLVAKLVALAKARFEMKKSLKCSYEVPVKGASH